MLLMILMITLSGCSLTSQYERANTLLAKGRYSEAARIYEELGFYEDSVNLALYAKAADAGERGDFTTCLNGFTNLGEFRDSPQLLTYYTAQQYLIQATETANAGDVSTAYSYFMEASKLYHSLSFSVYPGAEVGETACLQAMYDLPAALANNGDYVNAANTMSIFVDHMQQEYGEVGVYADAPIWVDYYTACQYEANGNYTLAAKQFAQLGNFYDANQRCEAIRQVAQQAAEVAIATGDHITAWVLLISLQEFPNLSDQTKENLYLYGEKLFAGCDYVEATMIFTTLGSYKDASMRTQECWYAQGESLLNASKYEAAKVAFSNAGEYSDAQELAAKGCDYQKAITQMAAGDYLDAYFTLQRIKDYRDVDTLLKSEELMKTVFEMILNGDCSHFAADGMLAFRTKDWKYGYLNTVTGEIIEPQWDDAKDFSEGLAAVLVDGKMGYIDKTGAMVIAPQWDDAQAFTDGFAVVQDVLYGYIDRNGNVISDYQWSRASAFSDGFAQVLSFDENNRAAYGFVDQTGRVIDEPKWDQIDPFYEGLASVKLNNKWGVVDITGKVISEPQWDWVYPFSDGIAKIRLDDKYGFIDKNGTVISEPQWDSYVSFSEGMAWVETNNGFGCMDKTGTMVIEPYWHSAKDFSEGLAEVDRLSDALGNTYTHGYIDRTGTMVFEFRDFAYGGYFKEGVASFNDSYGHYGYIDKKGKVISEAQWDDAMYFSNGLARVKKNERWGFIDQNGTIVIEPQYSHASDFVEGLAKVAINGKLELIDKTGKIVNASRWKGTLDSSTQLSKYRSSGYYSDSGYVEGGIGYYDHVGKTLIKPRWDNIGLFSDGVAVIMKGDKYGYIDQIDFVISEPQWDLAEKFSDGLAYVERNGEFGFINQAGEIVLGFGVLPSFPLQYDYSQP